MPHVNSSGGDDLASTDEVKVYKDEGEEENEKRSSENLSEDKLGLVTESEEGKSSDIEGRTYPDEKGGGGSQDGKSSDSQLPERLGGLPYPLITPYPFPNGATLPGGLGNKILQPSHGLTPFYMYPNDHFSPPPAHMGIPPVHIDPKTGLPRHPMYALPPPPGQFPHPLYGPEFAQHLQGYGSPTPPGYLPSSYRGPFPTSLSSSPLSRFSPTGLLPPHPSMPPGLPHPGLLSMGPKDSPNSDSHRQQSFLSQPHEGGYAGHPNGAHHSPSTPESVLSKKNRIKKPLNAFMLFMKEMRQTVIEECTLKESAAINQILGRRWHALDRSEQAKYYDMARKEKELHMQLYPGWSARDNYASHAKKKILKRKRQDSGDSKGLMDDCAQAKKCRARFGLDQQTQWCKPCRRKKKCIRFLEDGEEPDDGDNSNDDDDDVGPYSVATTTSSTDHPSELGSPLQMPSSTSVVGDTSAGSRGHRSASAGAAVDDSQHHEVSQSGQRASPLTKVSAATSSVPDSATAGNNNNNNNKDGSGSSSAKPPTTSTLSAKAFSFSVSNLASPASSSNSMSPYHPHTHHPHLHPYPYPTYPLHFNNNLSDPPLIPKPSSIVHNASSSTVLPTSVAGSSTASPGCNVSSTLLLAT